MPGFYVRSVWYIGASPDRVWSPLVAVEDWARWWPEVVSSMVLETGYGSGHGSLKRCTWRGSVGPEFVFNLRVTRVVRESLVEAEIRGRLEGTTRWVLTPQEKGSAVRMEWRFRTNIWWMGIFGPIARRLYSRIFDSILHSGGVGLADHLRVPLLPAETIRSDRETYLV